MQNNTQFVDGLVTLVQEYEAMSSAARLGPAGQAVRERIRVIGEAADYFEGFEGMQRLLREAESRVGDDGSMGRWLDGMWDRVGEWVS
jgi:hypothetical protein